jgi:maltose alpha-D-glucosyltransferase/alpha-amylase
MLRSFDYAVHTALLGSTDQGVIRQRDVQVLEPWALFWRQWVSSAFLRAYVPSVRDAALIPTDRDHLRGLLRALLLDKAVYELGYELNNRPGWARIPIRGLLDLLGSEDPDSPQRDTTQRGTP